MEQPSESETLNGDTKYPRNSGVLELVATTVSEEEDAVGDQHSIRTASPTADAVSEPFSPPFWKGHERTNSAASDVSMTGLGQRRITLEDHSDEFHEVGRACWAKHVTIDDYVVIGGGSIAGAYVVWNCSVETLKGAPFVIRKRFVSRLRCRACSEGG